MTEAGTRAARQADAADDQTKLKEHDGSIEGMQTAIKDLKNSDTRQNKRWPSRPPSRSNSPASINRSNNSSHSSVS